MDGKVREPGNMPKEVTFQKFFQVFSRGESAKSRPRDVKCVGAVKTLSREHRPLLQVIPWALDDCFSFQIPRRIKCVFTTDTPKSYAPAAPVFMGLLGAYPSRDGAARKSITIATHIARRSFGGKKLSAVIGQEGTARTRCVRLAYTACFRVSLSRGNRYSDSQKIQTRLYAGDYSDAPSNNFLSVTTVKRTLNAERTIFPWFSRTRNTHTWNTSVNSRWLIICVK